MSNDNVNRGFAEGIHDGAEQVHRAVQDVVAAATKATKTKPWAITLAEVGQWLDHQNPAFRSDLEMLLYDRDLSLEPIEPDTPRRIWILKSGQWLSPRCNTDPYEPLPAPPVFLGGDEFGHRSRAGRVRRV